MSPEEARGLAVARALAGSWRAAPPAPTLTPAELDELAPHLLATAASGLTWRTIRDTPVLAERPAGAALRAGAQMHLLHAGLHERRLAAVLELCAVRGVDPLLAKGWTVARHYPERGLRPYGDVDLLVGADERPGLRAALDARAVDGAWVDVDLEHAFARADGTALAELRARGRRLVLGAHRPLVPGAEDELRLLCVHFLRGGGWRALALCDIALLLERAGTRGDLDWRLVLPADRARRQWVALTIALAVTLLGADPAGTPFARRVPSLPAWVRAHVLRGFALPPGARAPAPPITATARPRQVARQLAARWPPDPLEIALHHRWPVPTRGRHLLGVVDGAERLAGLLAARPLARGSRHHLTR